MLTQYGCQLVLRWLGLRNLTGFIKPRVTLWFHDASRVHLVNDGPITFPERSLTVAGHISWLTTSTGPLPRPLALRGRARGIRLGPFLTGHFGWASLHLGIFHVWFASNSRASLGRPPRLHSYTGRFLFSHTLCLILLGHLVCSTPRTGYVRCLIRPPYPVAIVELVCNRASAVAPLNGYCVREEELSLTLIIFFSSRGFLARGAES
jgi:hypothetical protein